MRIPPEEFTPKHYEPGKNEKCLKFKSCCKGKYAAANDAFQAATAEGDSSRALKYARRHFTWYALNHKAHTVPWLASGNFAGRKLLRTDIYALAEILDKIQRSYLRLKMGKEFLKVLEHVTTAIDDPRWRDKIHGARALWLLHNDDDPVAAYEELCVVDIAKSQDSTILALYLQLRNQLHPREFPMVEFLTLVDRIIKHTPNEAWILQYSILKGLKYYLVLQPLDGSRIIEEALKNFESLPPEKRSDYGKFHYLHALELYGNLAGKPELLEKAVTGIGALIAEVESDEKATGYVGELYKLLADCESHLNNHGAAAEFYSRSMEKAPSELTKVFYGRSLSRSGSLSQARDVLTSVSEKQLNQAGKFDLAISWAHFASESHLESDLEHAIELMKSVQAHDPIFLQLRDQWIIDLLETEPKTRQVGLKNLLEKINRYFSLNPNWNGLGVDFNRMISDYVKSDD